MGQVSEATLNATLLAALNRITGKAYQTVPMDLPAEDVGLDSLGLSQVILHLEETLGRDIEDGVLLKLIEAETIGDFQIALAGQFSERSAAPHA